MIVTDTDLKNLILQKDNPLLTNFDPPDEKQWYDKNSLVQPCSLDLHIGTVFKPGVKCGKPGSATNPKSELVLKTGQTAIVVTQESIHLPSSYAGFGFPPSHISSRALLMTNPGHIDPGYNGQLQFTVINMGREDYVLRKKDLIVTLLIFNLGESAIAADYAARNANAAAKKIAQTDIDVLSADFVDVEKRATQVARKTLGFATLIATILAVILGWAFNAVDKRLEGIDDLKTRMTKLEDTNSQLSKQLQTAKEELDEKIQLEHRLTMMESKH